MTIATLSEQVYPFVLIERAPVIHAFLLKKKPDVSMSETKVGTWLEECFGSSFNLRNEDEHEIQPTQGPLPKSTRCNVHYDENEKIDAETTKIAYRKKPTCA
jgi:hypothetical protein